ncbi:GMC family oxidoreductase [Curtobacterium sp. RRHDQ10]|uniref:GMC family oxidoreductase n=1 Tax=Curtobacterium phyllosphaerae TaxID=3413379 RepID=UPI003BF323ED
MTRKVDVIVVGAGASGALIASELAQAGKKVVCIDKGAAYTDEDFKLKFDEIRYYARGAIIPNMTDDPMTWRNDEGGDAAILPWVDGPLGTVNPLHLPPSLGTGGGSIHWGGATWRFRESEFRMRSTIAERVGEGVLPENHTLVDWPISYQDLEPYYDKAEWELGISGKGNNIAGHEAESRNPWEAPRTRDYPMPPLRQGPADQQFADACDRLGMHPFRTAAAIASEKFKDRDGCTYCGFCHGYACHTNAKTSTHVASLPYGLASGNLEVLDYCRVYRVNRSANGRSVIGVSYYDQEGRSTDIEADQVVLACYALENARLLLASGINRNGQVGKHFMTHAFGFFMGLTKETSNPFMGPLVASTAIEDFSGELVHDHDPNVAWGAPIISWPGDYQPLEIAQAMPANAPRWGSGFREWMRDNYTHIWAMYSQTANIPRTDTYVDLDPVRKDRHGEPVLRMTHGWSDTDQRGVEFLLTQKRRIAQEMGLTTWWEETTNPDYHISTHEVGTHRMGEDPATSVVDMYGRSHECENLYVVGGGQFPSYHGYNPTETIWALNYMTVDQMLGRPLMTSADIGRTGVPIHV